jgi:hypothetical protein
MAQAAVVAAGKGQSKARDKDYGSEFHYEAWTPRFNPWIVAFTVTLATFMEALDSSIANVALPHIAGTLGASYDEATWVLTSYLVSNAIVLPISGWIANRIGRKTFYMSCVALFTAFSFLCGLATTLPMLIIFRVIQGAAGGGLQHVSSGKAERCVCAVRDGSGGSSGDWSNRGWVDHGQLHVAVDLLFEYSGGDSVADSDEQDCGGSAVFEASKG